MHGLFFVLFVDPFSARNVTIEERVALLEIQVVEIEEDVTGLEADFTDLEGYVDFLFDEHRHPGRETLQFGGGN